LEWRDAGALLALNTDSYQALLASPWRWISPVKGWQIFDESTIRVLIKNRSNSADIPVVHQPYIAG
tara:strand:+ start:530 stop:727 length:198 start_codon:yes stop_codon:yes gene_type:complete